MRICLIINPVAGQSRPGAALPQIQECLSTWCAEVVVKETAKRGDGEKFARALQPGEFDLCVAAGGDGTINEVLNGLPEHTPLGVIPLGTANVLALELKVPLNDIPAACAILRDCKPLPMDLGWCDGRKFCLMAGIGFDAEAVKEVPPSIKDLLGAPAYVLSALKALTTLPESLRYRLTLNNGQVIASRGLMLVIANAANYGGPLQIATEASMSDGKLDLCLFRERSKVAFMGQLFWVLLRRQRNDPRFAYYQARSVRVECTPPASVQLDGDYVGRTPVEIKVLPGAVRVVRPE